MRRSSRISRRASRFHRRKRQFRRAFQRTQRVTRRQVTVKTGLGLPLKNLITHKYCHTIDNWAINPLFFGANPLNFAANGLYSIENPAPGGGAHQPYLFDQMCLLYDHYTVLGSKIKITIIPNDSTTTAASAARFALYTNDDTSVTPLTMDGVCEQTDARWKVYDGSKVNTRPVTFVKKYSAKKRFGASILANDALRGNAGPSATNPDEMVWFTLAGQSLDTQTTESTYSLSYEITYIVMYTEPREVAMSS